MSDYLWTSEYVGKGHPDKVADQISDAVLDACLEQDPFSRVACETMVKDRHVILAGEITTKAEVDYAKVVKSTLAGAGYNYKPIIQNLISQQSPEISAAVGEAAEGAGDQGIMFGYACNETYNLMPIALMTARTLVEKLHSTNLIGNTEIFTDCKTQATIKFSKERFSLQKAVVSVHHGRYRKKDFDHFRNEVKRFLLENTSQQLSPFISGSGVEWVINPAGPWLIGGPKADCGLTGRKIVVDAYGADCPWGGGALSGKDPTKVDRSAAYMARYIAKNVVATGYATKATVQLSYAIGISKPTSFRIITNNPSQDRVLTDYIASKVDLRPKAIIERLNLRRPIYLHTARDGHFGFSASYDEEVEARPWEGLGLSYELAL
jgi:S-adenosylmethionine synthetase